MGLLDDAIREHLDLKRRRGGDPEDNQRMEREALGPVRREPTTPESQFDDDPAPNVQEHYADEPATGSFEAPAAAAAPASYDDPFDDAGFDGDDYFEDQPTEMHEAPVEPPEEHEHKRFGLFGRKSKHQDEPVDDEPIEAEAHDVYPAHDQLDEDPEFDEAPVGDYHRDLHDHDPIEDDPFARDDDPFAREPAQASTPEDHRPEPPQLDVDETPPPPRRPRFTGTPPRTEAPDGEDLVDRAAEPDDSALRAPDTAERAPREPHEPEQWDDETQLFEFDEDAPPAEAEPDDEEAGEELLEGTPDFLQDTPDHDRLWFEQKPPRDFDFGN
jgi:hypothetical protein